VPLVSVAAATVRSADPVDLLLSDVDAEATQILTVALPVFFALLLTRLVLAAIAFPRRRKAVAALAVAIALWAAGATALNDAGVPASIRFPAPGEGFFVGCSVSLAAYLLLDRPSRSTTPLATWLDAAIVGGGGVSLAGVVIVTPVAGGFSRQGVPLLVAVLYPILDVFLVALLVAQVVVGARSWSRRTVMTVGGLVALTVADTSIVVQLSAGTYRYGALLDLTWTVGFLLLVGGACRPADSSDLKPHTLNGSGRLTVAAAVTAIAVLTAEPPGQARLLLTVPAVLTLFASAARLLQAVRQARDAADAYRLSLTDDLTGLPNRRALTRHVSDALARREPTGLLLLDLDGFKEVNDTLGHAAGDALLQIVATRMDHALDGAALVVRLGGDEFAIVVPSADEINLLESAHLVRALIRKPALVDGMDLTLDCSIGVAVSTTSMTRPGDLLRRADVAMYQAKTARVGSLLYDAARDEFSRTRLALAEDLRRGIARGELELWFQPQLDTATGAIVSLEALVRWRHPQQGILAPGAFLAAARRSGLMPVLTEATIEAAVRHAKTWYQNRLSLKVAVNIAPAELLADHVMSTLLERIHAAGLPPDQFVVEVTEDSFLAEPERARDVLTDLHAGGLEVSIDDYGTGFSSLAYLRDLPLQELKIDRSFVAHIESDHRSLMIVTTTTDLAHGLGLRVVAEGVEDGPTAARLRQLGVDLLQGYHIARPMPADQIQPWLLGRRSQATVR
jgi:diguanylate cyclase (GGDEF)-like protein